MTALQPSESVKPEEPGLVIQPRRGWIAIDWSELLRYRELLFFLIWRDIKVRYKQAILGVGWAVLQPVINMIIFTVIFGVAAGMRKNLPPELQEAYPVFVFTALLPWQLFSSALNLGGMSLVNQQHLLTKIYFPRLFVPTASVGSALVDMAISFGIFLLLMVWYQIVPPATILFVPLLVLLTLMLALGMAYLLSALTVSYRDFRFLIPFMTQIWMWLSFVAFPVSILGDAKWKWLLAFNPMFGIITAYRKAILGLDGRYGWDSRYFLVSVVMTIAIFVFGLFYFRRTERRFADIA